MRLIILSCLIFSFNVFAQNKGDPLPENANLREIFEQIKDVPVSYDPDGIVCEQVARVELAKEYPPARFDIAVGIEYRLKENTLGELDIVIFDKTTHNVVLVAEVKCWKSYAGGLDKAMEQRGRFTWVLQNNPKTLKMLSHEGLQVKSEQFIANKNYQTISQLGGVHYGYDRELTFTLRELKRLRTMLLRCKVWEGCAEKVGD